jgi:hypothetical protein
MANYTKVRTDKENLKTTDETKLASEPTNFSNGIAFHCNVSEPDIPQSFS